MNDANRVVETASKLCDLILPDGFEEQCRREGSVVERSDLFEVKAQIGDSAILLEIDSQFTRVKSLLIGKGGNNIRAICSICTSVSRQEGFKLFDISVVKNGKR